jgi:hypothetical protein
MTPPRDDAIVPNARRTKASALYGLIIAGAVLATAGPEARLAFVAVSLVATLTVYWVAETYVHVMAERQAEHHELSRAQMGAIARDGLPLITVSAIPLAILLAGAVLGIETALAEDLALYANTILLLIGGYRMSRDAGVTGGRLVVSTMISGLLGLAMVGLKIVLNH